jgi:hypothetical protein
LQVPFNDALKVIFMFAAGDSGRILEGERLETDATSIIGIIIIIGSYDERGGRRRRRTNGGIKRGVVG